MKFLGINYTFDCLTTDIWLPVHLQIRERFKRRMNTISPYAVDGNFTKKGSHVNLGDAGNVWTVELQSFNN